MLHSNLSHPSIVFYTHRILIPSSTHAKCKYLEVTGRPNPELADLMAIARGGGGFFDTGERYGSHAKTALGMGWVSG